MGFLDQVLRGHTSASETLDPREAFTSILLLTVAGDGHISDEESEAFITVSNRMELFRGQTPAAFNSMINKLLGLLSKHGPAFLLEKAVESLPRDLRETSFAVAADLVFADGSVEQEERDLLERLRTVLQIEEHRALQIVEVLCIKNRG